MTITDLNILNYNHEYTIKPHYHIINHCLVVAKVVAENILNPELLHNSLC